MKFKKILKSAEQQMNHHAFAFVADDMNLYTYVRTFKVKTFTLIVQTERKLRVYSNEKSEYLESHEEICKDLKIAGLLNENGEFAYKKAKKGRRITPCFALFIVEFAEPTIKSSGAAFIYDNSKKICCKMVLLSAGDLQANLLMCNDVVEIITKNLELSQKIIDLMKENPKYTVIDVETVEEEDI